MEPVTHLLRTDNGIKNINGAFFCSNMRADPQGGVMADYNLSNLTYTVASTISEGLKKMTGLVQRKYVSTAVPAGEIIIWGTCAAERDLFAAREASDKYFRTHNYEQTGSVARGIAIDVNNEIIYTGNRYLGKTITTELDGVVTAADNTITVASVTGVPTTGQAFIVNNTDSVDYSEVISYTGISTKTLTGVTRGVHNTTDRNHSTGLEIVFFDDDWKDMGAAQTTEIRPIGRFGDYSFVGNLNQVAGYKETDGSDWATDWLTLPTGFKIVDFSTILTGAGYKCLIAANKDNQGSIFVWDVPDTSYEREIVCGENIKKLHDNYVGLGSGIYKIDGYSISIVAPLPDDEADIRSADFSIYDIKRKERVLIITADCAQYDRNRSGVWILNLDTKEWFYLLPSHYGTYGTGFGAIFISSTWRMIVSHDYGDSTKGAIDLITTAPSTRGNYYQVIYNPKDVAIGRTLKLSELKLGIDFKTKDYYHQSSITVDVIVRAYDFTRPFLQYTELAAASSSADEMVVSKTLGVPQVGDRVEIIERKGASHTDVAAAPRNITAIATGTNYTLTLDDDLPATINAATATGTLEVLITPLKLIKKIQITTLTNVLQDFTITAEDTPEFKKLMLEVEFRITAVGGETISPRLNYIEITSNIQEK